MAILLHGTTLQRAKRIKENGPDVRFIEPGGNIPAESFSACLAEGPYFFGPIEEYARRKSADFPNEGGAAILAVDVPDPIIALAISEWFPLSQGLVQFEANAGLEELLVAWPTLWKEIRPVDCS